MNGLPLVVVECQDRRRRPRANPMHDAFEQLLRYRNGRPETTAAGPARGRAAAVPHQPAADPHLRREGRVRHHHLGAGALLRLEGHLARDATGLHAAAGRGARAGAADPGHARAGDPARHPAHLHGVHGHRLGRAHQGGVPLPAVPRRATRSSSGCARRQGPGAQLGVVWHTQGSGKSLTMVFVARMLRAAADLQDFKIVLVNDRIDLEEQLAGTATLIGGQVNVIESTAELREHLSTDAPTSTW